MLLIYSAVFKIKYYLKSLFFLIASLSFIGLVFVFNPTLGTRDWDILAFAAVACNVSNAHFLLMLYDKKWCKNIKYGILMVAGFSICHTSMWLLTSKTDASIQWVERAYSTDNFRMNKDLTNENLVGKILSANNVYDRAIHWWLIYYQKHPEDPRSSYNVARALVELNRKEEACAILEENIKIFPFYDLAYALLIDLYVESFNDDALYAVLVQMEQAYKQRPEVFIRQQLSQEDLNNYWGALAELRQMRAARQ
ncbi:hypothetical protein AGMMS4957_10400 [Bacteroidia bacterium]|nr:hypothetical protein AGMMS4957_10400 [Bacteroidia bacterium]